LYLKHKQFQFNVRMIPWESTETSSALHFHFNMTTHKLLRLLVRGSLCKTVISVNVFMIWMDI